MSKWFSREMIPGIMLAGVVGGVAQMLGMYIPKLGAATLAILLGILLGNTCLHQPVWSKGTKFAEGKFLEVSVMLLGLTLTVQSLQAIGWRGALFVVLQMSGTIAFVLWYGKRLRFNQVEAELMAGGNAICGSSAIASIAPVIDADDDQAGKVITIVNLMGTVLMLGLPLLTPVLVGSSNLLKGALIGGTVQSVGQVIASASMVNAETVTYATLFKIMRIVLLVFAVLFFAARHKQEQTQGLVAESTKPKKFLIPWYVIGFAAFCLLNSLLPLPSVFENLAHTTSNWLEVIALAAIGLRLDLRAFLREGKQILAYGAGTVVCQILLATLLIRVLIF